MVNRAVAGVEGETPRFWFDQAVAAQLDAPGAHRTLRWAIRPRWGGSHEEMLRFGLECLNTRRFDTSVPDVFADVVFDIKEENGGFSCAHRRVEGGRQRDPPGTWSIQRRECPAEMRQAAFDASSLEALYYLGLRRPATQERGSSL